LLETEKLVILY